MNTIDRKFLRFNMSVIVVAGILLFAIVAATFAFTSRTEEQATRGLQAGAVNRRVQMLLTIVVDAETGQRGYLLTRDDSYLTPYRDALARYDSNFAMLRQQVAALPDLRNLPDIADFDRLARAKFAELDRTIALVRNGESSSALALVNTDTGENLTASARKWVDDFTEKVSALRAAQVDGMRVSVATLTWLTISAAVLLLVLIAGATILVLRHTRELEHARRALVDANKALGSANAELEERVLERTQGLTRANEEVQRYAYIVSHDLRAPLVNIMGFTGEIESAAGRLTDYLQRNPVLDDDPAAADIRAAITEDIPEALGFIRTSMTRMDGLINEILRLSRLGRRELEPETLDMNALADGCIETVRHRLNERGAEAILDGRLPEVVSDRFSLQQIFANLLDNAVKYLDPARPGRIVLRGSLRGPFAHFEVEDNGRGIAPADHERIFELFRRSGVQDRPGEGIGLAHVRTLVRRLGGDISVESDGRSGTIFRVTIVRDLRLRLRSNA